MAVTRTRQKHSGLSLTDTVLAIVMVALVVLGTGQFKYYAMRDARKATVQVAAGRIALLLCESWHGTGGDPNYDPVAHLGSDITITPAESSAEPNEFTLLGSYLVSVDGVTHHVTASWRDISSRLRALNVTVLWPDGLEAADGNEPASKVFELTTYCER